MVDQGFSEDENLNALMSLSREKAIELLPENQTRVLRFIRIVVLGLVGALFIRGDGLAPP